MLTINGTKEKEKSKRGCYINRTTEYPFNGYPVFKTTITDNKQDLTNNYCVYNSNQPIFDVVFT